MKKIAGYFFYTIGKIIDFLLTLLMTLVLFLVDFFSGIKRAVGLLISLGGCLFFIFLFVPFLNAYLRNPYFFTIVTLVIVVPFIGRIAHSYLKYIHYIATEYFYERADHYLLGEDYIYHNLDDYKDKYRKEQQRERIKREEEERKRAQEEQKRRFREFGGYTFTFGEFEDFEDFFNSMGYENANQQRNAYGNFYGQNSFEEEYQKACKELGVDYDADKYQIKLAYRKLAKAYHPDINKEAGANEKFQRINNAYEFLNDNNIERYKNLKRR